MNRNVKALLIKKGIKQKEIAAELQVTTGLVSGVLGGYFESRRVKEAIANKLQMPYGKVWGKAA